VSVPNATLQTPAPTRAADPPLEPQSAGRVFEQRTRCKDVSPGLPESGHHGGVGHGRRRPHGGGVTAAARVALDVDDVLHRDRDTVQRPVRGTQWCGEQCHHRVKRPAESLGPLVAGQQFQVGDLAGALAPLDRLDQSADIGGQRPGEIVQQVGDLGLALAHHEIPIDAAV
jgi:hypothetical protein